MVVYEKILVGFSNKSHSEHLLSLALPLLQQGGELHLQALQSGSPMGSFSASAQRSPEILKNRKKEKADLAIYLQEKKDQVRQERPDVRTFAHFGAGRRVLALASCVRETGAQALFTCPDTSQDPLDSGRLMSSLEIPVISLSHPSSSTVAARPPIHLSLSRPGI